MRLPRYVLIAGQRWRVDTVPKLARDGDTLDGWTEPSQRRIYINRDLGAEGRRDTLLHELLHACTSMAGVTLGEDVEEDLVTRLTPFLLSLLADNDLCFR